MKYLINKIGKINTSVLFVCIIFLILELIGHRHGETSIEDILFFPAIFGFLSCIIIFGHKKTFPKLFFRVWGWGPTTVGHLFGGGWAPPPPPILFKPYFNL